MLAHESAATNVQMAESTATGPDGNEAVQQLQAQVNALYARLEQQQVAAAGREAELQGFPTPLMLNILHLSNGWHYLKLHVNNRG